MADPLTTATVTKKVQVTGYAGLQAGTIKGPEQDAYLNSGAILGGEIDLNNKSGGATFFKGKVIGGSALGAEFELGQRFSIGRNMGLEISANVEKNISTTYDNNATATSTAQDVIVASGIETPYESTIVTENRWKSGITKYSGKAMVTFGSKNLKIGVGLEAGTISNRTPNTTFSHDHKMTMAMNGVPDEVLSLLVNHKTCEGTLTTNKTKGFVLPRVSVERDFGKRVPMNLKFESNIRENMFTFGITLGKKAKH